MKLVIDIPQTMIDDLRDGCFGVKHNNYDLAGLIMNGIALDQEAIEVKASKLQALDGQKSYCNDMTINKAIKTIEIAKAEVEWNYPMDYQIAFDMAIKALKTIEEFENKQIIIGGRLNGRTYAYKCGLSDGKRIKQDAVNVLVDELARAISDERCFISRGRSTEAIIQDILDLPND